MPIWYAPAVKRAKVLLRVLVGLFGFGVGCALAVWLVLWVSLRSTAVRVPEVVGLEPARAMVTLQQAGLLGRVETGVFSADYKVGTVAVQRPGPGFQLKRGSTVLLQPSLGSAAVRVPELAGLPESLAEAQLESDGLAVGRVCTVDGAAGAVVVLASSPPATAMVAPASSVVLLANREPEETLYVMPDFVGSTRDEAEGAIRALGFRLATVQQVVYPGARPGTVLRQDPPAGGPVAEAAVVGLWVSR